MAPLYLRVAMAAAVAATLTATLTATLASSAACAAERLVIRLCQDSEDVHPWTFRDRPGLNNVLLDMVAAKAPVAWKLTRAPWRRCQQALESGAADAIIGISFLPERQAFGVFPMKDGRPDAARRLMVDGYSLYRRRGDARVSWDGNSLLAHGPIAAQRSYSVVLQLQALNVPVDIAAYSVEDNLRKLVREQVAAVALRTGEGNQAVASGTEFAGKVEKLPVNLAEKAYYLMFSKQFVARHGVLAQQIWDLVAQVRESPEYRAAEADFR